MALLWIDTFENGSQGEAERSADAHADTTNGSSTALGGPGDYFYRTDETASDESIGLNVAFTGFNGDFIWRGEDVEDSAGGAANTALEFLNWNNIDITGATNISIAGLFGSRQGGAVFEVGDFLIMRFRVDSDTGAYTNALSFIGNGVQDDGLIWDENNNGVIDGGETTQAGEAMALFSFSLAGITGTTLDIQIQANVGVSEEIAFDDIQVNADLATSGPINGTAAADNLMGTLADDEINGLAGNDTLAGGGTTETDGGNDTLNGGAGNDRLFGQGGDDILNGGAGNDQLWGQEGADVLDGGDGIDGAYYINATGAVALNVATGGTAGHAAGDTYTNIERFFGSQFGDTLDGAASNDFLYGLSGNDTINGAGGNDILVGGLGNDTINGGDDNDTILGSQGTDILNGDAGNDTLRGGADDDMLNGGDDNDTLDGGAGADTLNGGAGIDRAIYTTATEGVTANLGEEGSAGDADGDIYINIENLYGSFHDDSLTGDAADNLIVGLAGDDALFGDGGNDRLIGSAGNDRLNGGEGNDTLIGQADADTFVFTGSSEVGDLDRIIDFEDGVDIIELAFFGFVDEFSDLTLTQVGNHVRVEENTDVTGSTNDAAFLVFNTNLADLTEDDFDIFFPQESIESFDLIKSAPALPAQSGIGEYQIPTLIENPAELIFLEAEFIDLI